MNARVWGATIVAGTVVSLTGCADAARDAIPAGEGSRVHAVDLYGLRTIQEQVVRAAVGLKAGDTVPASVAAISARLRALAGVADVEVSAVCCSDSGGTTLYVGVREAGTPSLEFRAAPAGAARLPGDIVAAGARFEEALISAVRRGVTGEDGSNGYSLSADSAVRSVQGEYVRMAAARFDALATVLRESADAEHRALAAQILAYGTDRQRIARELVYAVGDPADEVRNNATRALWVLAQWATTNRESGVVIEPGPFIDLLNSVSWTDRNKAVLVLMALTESRDPSVLARLRAGAIPSLAEMAQWENDGHALGPFLVLSRVAGIGDGDAFSAWERGRRDSVIAHVRATVR